MFLRLLTSRTPLVIKSTTKELASFMVILFVWNFRLEYKVSWLIKACKTQHSYLLTCSSVCPIKYLTWQSSHAAPIDYSVDQNRNKFGWSDNWWYPRLYKIAYCTIKLMNTLLIFNRFHIKTNVISTHISIHQDKGWIIILLMWVRCNEHSSLWKTEYLTSAANNSAQGQEGNMKGN